MNVATAGRVGPVTVRPEGNEHTTVMVHEVGGAVTDPLAWAAEHRDALRATLHQHGAIMLRGFSADVADFNRLAETLGGDLLDYTERSTPRSTVAGNVYTSTEYPPDQSIPMHNESSYSDPWPGLLFFQCVTAAQTRGATPIADSRAVLRLLPADVRARFAGGVVYTRSFREGLGLSWQESFQTDDRAQVERYCTEHGQEFTWTDDGLRTRHHRPATRTEPYGGAEVWFNQANLFHVSALDPEIREALEALYPVEDLPRHALYGDGSPIPDADLDAVRVAYETASVALPWSAGDIMVVENILAAHGREPFTGARRVLVAMTAA